MIDDMNFDDKVKEIIANYLRGNAFADRKLTDTPTDSLQIVPRKFVTANGTTSNRPSNPVTGQHYFDTTLNQEIWWNGTSWITWTNATAVDKQIFTASGTWTKPSGCTTVHVVCIGSGGGGGSGARYGAGTSAQGGSGGAGGAVTFATFNASDLGTTETIIVAPLASGGNPVLTNDTSGNYGTDGTNSSFGTWLTAGGGGAGAGFGSGSASGGGPGGGSFSSGTGTTQIPGSPKGAASVDAFASQGAQSNGTTDGLNSEFGGASGGGVQINGDAFKGGSSIYSGGGGGSGGGITNGNVVTNPGQGGNVGAYTVGSGGAAGTSGASPTAGTDGGSNATLKKGYGGAGGGGGGSSTGVAATAGGTGGIPGGGGGGGGASRNGSQSGFGGNGARGEVRVYSF